MIYTAQITIMPLKELLDPQGKAVEASLHNLELTNIENVRIGKHITITIDAKDESEAKSIAELACKKMLYNQVMETYEIAVSVQA